MKVTDTDYQNILAKIDLQDDYPQEIEYEKGNETLFFTIQIRTDGYEEDDYFNGTGAFVATDIDIEIDNVSCDNEEGETPTDFDTEKLKNLVFEDIRY